MSYCKRLPAGLASAAFALALTAPLARAGVTFIVPATPPTAPLAFETAANWTATQYATPPSLGPELTPPGFNSTFFIENFTGTVVLSQPRNGNGNTGEADTMELGAMAVGGGNLDQVATLVIAADVTFNGLERAATGEYNTQLRHVRVGRDDTTPAAINDGTTAFPWGIVKQTAGTVRLTHHLVSVATGPVAVTPQLERGEILLSSDKDASAGSTWEVGGTASLILPDDLRIGDRPTATSMPGAIFRVRGSHVGTVEVGDIFQAASDAGLWDADRPEEFGNRLRFNRGKSISEFVLDVGGVTPVTVLDNLDIGDVSPYPTSHPMAGANEYSYGFLRIKLSEPTAAGSGAAGSGNELVLFKADRITTDAALPTLTDYDEGRFFDPDRPSASGPHRPLFDSDNAIDGPGVEYRALANYAGATYSWRLDYEDSADDDVVINAVILSNLMVTGTPGDYDGGGLAASDLNQIVAARGTAIPLGSAQNQFDLNADDAIDNLDAMQWITHAGLKNSRLGDFDLDGDVDAADLTTLRGGYGTGSSYAAGDANFDGAVDGRDFLVWQRNVGGPNPTVGAAGAVPEPGAVALLALGGISLLSARRRR